MTLFSASQLQATAVQMNADNDAFMLVRVNYFELSVFFQLFHEIFLLFFYLFFNREMRNPERESIFQLFS